MAYRTHRSRRRAVERALMALAEMLKVNLRLVAEGRGARLRVARAPPQAREGLGGSHRVGRRHGLHRPRRPPHPTHRKVSPCLSELRIDLTEGVRFPGGVRVTAPGAQGAAGPVIAAADFPPAQRHGARCGRAPPAVGYTAGGEAA